MKVNHSEQQKKKKVKIKTFFFIILCNTVPKMCVLIIFFE